jgi:hypothetical protein
MAIIEQCDCCEQASPDGRGSHISNDWIELTIRDRKHKTIYHVDPEIKKLLCRSCFETVRVVFTSKKAAQG